MRQPGRTQQGERMSENEEHSEPMLDGLGARMDDFDWCVVETCPQEAEAAEVAAE